MPDRRLDFRCKCGTECRVLVDVSLPGTSAVLVVDDNESVAITLSLVLQLSGCDAKSAYSAKQAFDSLDEFPLDLAIVDIGLPGPDGVQTAVELCKRHPGCKIILVSGDPQATEVLERAKADGIDFPVLAKPVPIEELLSEIASLLKLRKEAVAKG
jgi:DNA-binding response OmpR family regulator